MTTDAHEKAVERLAKWLGAVGTDDAGGDWTSRQDIDAFPVWERYRSMARAILADIGLVAIDPALVQAVVDTAVHTVDHDSDADAPCPCNGRNLAINALARHVLAQVVPGLGTLVG